MYYKLFITHLLVCATKIQVLSLVNMSETKRKETKLNPFERNIDKNKLHTINLFFIFHLLHFYLQVFQQLHQDSKALISSQSFEKSVVTMNNSKPLKENNNLATCCRQ